MLSDRAMNVFADLPARDASLSRDRVIRNELWKARKGLYAAVAGNRPSGTTALLEDIAVPTGSFIQRQWSCRICSSTMAISIV
ncbi:MAG: hypothetical protein WDO06_03345 [Actinomycetota bacterium]